MEPRCSCGWTVPGSGGLIVHDVFPRWKRGRMWITWWYHDIMFDILYDLYEWKQCVSCFSFNIYLIGLRECCYGWWMVVWKCSVTKNAPLENPPNSWGLFFSTIWHPLENLGAYTFVLYHLFFKTTMWGTNFPEEIGLETEVWSFHRGVKEETPYLEMIIVHGNPQPSFLGGITHMLGV